MYARSPLDSQRQAAPNEYESDPKARRGSHRSSQTQKKVNDVTIVGSPKHLIYPSFGYRKYPYRARKGIRFLLFVTENHGVGGSIPPLGTIKFKHLAKTSEMKTDGGQHLVNT